jgi:hypothetical protein
MTALLGNGRLDLAQYRPNTSVSPYVLGHIEFDRRFAVVTLHKTIHDPRTKSFLDWPERSARRSN